MNYLVIENSKAVAVLEDFCLSKKDIRLNKALQEHFVAKVITVKEHDMDVNLEQEIDVKVNGEVDGDPDAWFSERIRLVPVPIYEKQVV